MRATLLALALLTAAGGVALHSDWRVLVADAHEASWAGSDLQILLVGGLALAGGQDFTDQDVTDALGRRMGRPATPVCYANPLVLRLAAELGGADLASAYRAWRAVNLALLALAAALGTAWLRAHALGWPLALAIPVALLAANDATWMALYYNQLNVVALVAILGAMLAARARQDELSGTLIALAACAKISPALLAVAAALGRRWRIVRAALATGAMLLALSVAWNGWEVHARYWRGISPYLGYGSLRAPGTFNASTHAWNLSPNGFLSRALLPEHATLVAACGWAIAALVLVLLARAARRLPPAPLLALAVAASFVTSSMTWPHHLLLATAPLLALVADAPRRTGWALLLAALASAALFLPLGALGGPDEIRDVAAKALACLVLLALAAGLGRRAGDREETPPEGRARPWRAASHRPR